MADPDVERALNAAFREPAAWLDQADQLKRAADHLLVGFQNDVAGWVNLATLEEAPPQILEIASNSAKGHLSAFSLGPVYLMVAGYAIENTAKGLIVARDDSEATIRWITREHVSAKLLSKAGITLIDGEPDLVRRMEARVRWAGRYPVPKTPNELEAAREGMLWTNVLRVSSGDGSIVNALYARMRTGLEAAVHAAGVAPGREPLE